MYTVFTNKPVSGAMRGYGIPQAMFAMESHTDDIAVKLGIPPYEYRWKYLMPKDIRMDFQKMSIIMIPSGNAWKKAVSV